MDDKNLFDLVSTLRLNELFTCVITYEPYGMQCDVHSNKSLTRILLDNNEERVDALNKKVLKIIDDHNVDEMLREIVTAYQKAKYGDEMEDGEAYGFFVDALILNKRQNDDNDQVGG